MMIYNGLIADSGKESGKGSGKGEQEERTKPKRWKQGRRRDGRIQPAQIPIYSHIALIHLSNGTVSYYYEGERTTLKSGLFFYS